MVTGKNIPYFMTVGNHASDALVNKLNASMMPVIVD